MEKCRNRIQLHPRIDICPDGDSPKFQYLVLCLFGTNIFHRKVNTHRRVLALHHIEEIAQLTEREFPTFHLGKDNFGVVLFWRFHHSASAINASVRAAFFVGRDARYPLNRPDLEVPAVCPCKPFRTRQIFRNPVSRNLLSGEPIRLDDIQRARINVNAEPLAAQRIGGGNRRPASTEGV